MVRTIFIPVVAMTAFLSLGYFLGCSQNQDRTVRDVYMNFYQCVVYPIDTIENCEKQLFESLNIPKDARY